MHEDLYRILLGKYHFGPRLRKKNKAPNPGLLSVALALHHFAKGCGVPPLVGPPRSKQNRCRASGGPPWAPGGNFMVYRVFLGWDGMKNAEYLS